MNKGRCAFKFLVICKTLLLSSYASSAYAQFWPNFFGPADYEECVADRIADISDRNAQNAVRRDCGSRFQARRDGRGGYEYCVVVTPSRGNYSNPEFLRRVNERVCVNTQGGVIRPSEWREIDSQVAQVQQRIDNEVAQLNSEIDKLPLEVYATCLKSVPRLGCITATINVSVFNRFHDDIRVFYSFNPLSTSFVGCNIGRPRHGDMSARALVTSTDSYAVSWGDILGVSLERPVRLCAQIIAVALD